MGASIGDCGQFRKPLLGSGSFVAVPFGAELNDGATLLPSSDGLLKHAPHERILSLMRECELQSAAVRLSELPRLRSGTLPDDVAVVLCRASPDEPALTLPRPSESRRADQPPSFVQQHVPSREQRNTPTRKLPGTVSSATSRVHGRPTPAQDLDAWEYALTVEHSGLSARR